MADAGKKWELGIYVEALIHDQENAEKYQLTLDILDQISDSYTGKLSPEFLQH